MGAIDRRSSIEHGSSEDRREALLYVYNSAVRAVRGDNLIRSQFRLEGDDWVYTSEGRRAVWPLDPRGRVFAIGAGKAAAAIMVGLEEALGPRLAGGCAIVKDGHHEPLKTIALLDAGHPIPNEAGVAATAKMLSFLEQVGPHDSVFVALTGGASALMVAPADGLTLADKAHVSRVLIASGANISEINTVRKRLSKVKGGRLLEAIDPARSMTLMISDIPEDDPAMIGSGPTMRDTSSPEEAIAIIERYGLLDELAPPVLDALRRPHPGFAQASFDRHQHIVMANSQTSLRAAQEAAVSRGYAVRVVDAHLEGPTHLAALQFAAAAREIAKTGGGQRTVVLAAGETTVKVTGRGRGGRNQEFALVAAQALQGSSNISVLASGTDGTDGPTCAAGAFADGSTIARARAAGLDPEAMLADNDSFSFFSKLNDLHVTGPTGTNVMDLVIGIID